MDAEKIEEIKKKVNKTVQMDFDISLDEFLKNTEDINLFSDIGIDTLDVVELIMDIEGIFEISISDDEFDSIDTLGDIYNVVICELEKKA